MSNRHRARCRAGPVLACIVTLTRLAGASTPLDTSAASHIVSASWCDSTEISDSLTPGGHRIPISVCSVMPAESTSLQHALTSVTSALTLYGRLTGVPYPWPYYHMRIEPARLRRESGGEATGKGEMVFRGPWPDVQTEQDRPDATAKILVHELAHQWFGVYVDCLDGSGWLAEGFADFMTGQAWGPHTVRARPKNFSSSITPTGVAKGEGTLPVIRPTLGESTRPLACPAFLGRRRRFGGTRWRTTMMCTIAEPWCCGCSSNTWVTPVSGRPCIPI
jgi:hypothetical protein